MQEKKMPKEDFDNNDNFDDMEDDNAGEVYANLKVNAIDLAIKACAVSDGKFRPENILDIAKDYFKFIIGDDEEDGKDE